MFRGDLFRAVDDKESQGNELHHAGKHEANQSLQFRTLTDQPAASEAELRLDVLDMEVSDDGGDGSLEAGEGAEISLTLRNYSHLAGSDAVRLTLQTEAPFVDVIDASVTTSVTNAYPEIACPPSSSCPSGGVPA